MTIKWIDEVSEEEFIEKNVLLRLDLNVPLDEDGNIADPFKIEQALPTIRRLLRQNAKLIVCSHLGQPKGKVKSSLSLEPVAKYLRDLLNNEVFFVHDSVGDGIIKLIAERQPGNLIFLENLRFNPGEEKNDPLFAKLLARNAQVYVNDAFATCHRAHASTEGVLKFFPEKCFGGLLLKKELEALDNIVKHPKKPFVIIIGAAKISSKIAVLINLMKKADCILIGGAMAYTFLKAKGQSVGQSLVEEDKILIASNLLKKAQELNIKVLLPVDHVVENEKIVESNQFLPHEIGFDIGPKTIEMFCDELKDAKTIFWNGPLGVFEKPEFSKGTFKIAQGIAHSKAFSVVGGGDSVLAIKKAGIFDKISFVSSGGGASLELLEGKELPALKALGYYDP